MNYNWQTKKLGEVCIIKPPKNEAHKKLESDDLVSFLPMEDLGILKKNLNLTKVRRLEEVSGSYTYFADGDVLLAKITPCFENGKLGIANNLRNGIGFGSSEYIVFRPNDDLISEYLFYFLSSERFREEGTKNMGGAVGHKRVSKEFIENYGIPIPPLPEQKRLVALLDELFEKLEKAKENAQKNLANAKELFEAYLQNAFANSKHEKKSLGTVCKIMGGGTPSKAGSNFAKYYNGNISWATVRDMRNDVIIDTEHKITEEAVKRSSTNIIPKNNVVIASRVGLGKICFLKNDTAINQDLRGIIPLNSNNLSVNYLFWWFKSIAKIIIQNGSGATVHGVKLPFIKNLEIPYPPFPEQQAIVARLDALSAETKKLESIYRQKLTALEELKKSILQKAFRGELAQKKEL